MTYFLHVKNNKLQILLFAIVIIFFTHADAFALPSKDNAGHSDLTEMSVKMKHDLEESNTNGLRKAMDDIKDFGQSLSSANVSEDDLVGGGLIGARHFYDPDNGNGYLGIFQNAKDRARS